MNPSLPPQLPLQQLLLPGSYYPSVEILFLGIHKCVGRTGFGGWGIGFVFDFMRLDLALAPAGLVLSRQPSVAS